MSEPIGEIEQVLLFFAFEALGLVIGWLICKAGRGEAARREAEAEEFDPDN